MLEAHQFTCEGLLALDDDMIIFVGTPLPGKTFSVDNLEAFLVPQGTFVKLDPFIIMAHSMLFIKNVHIYCACYLEEHSKMIYKQ